MIKILLGVGAGLAAAVLGVLVLVGQDMGFALAVAFIVFVGVMALAFPLYGLFELSAMVFMDRFGALLARRKRKDQDRES
ncbi:MAG TPA: hypothetical protein PLV42_01935 [bacterium]|nr:hypothetical protein [bacterium]